jgi:hypothetical protein
MTARQILIWLAGAVQLAAGMLLFFSLFGNTTYKYFRHARNIWGEEVDLPGYRRFSGFFVAVIMIVMGVLLIFKAFGRL